MGKKCLKCGNILNDDAKFCDKCGVQVEQSDLSKEIRINNQKPKRKYGCLIATLIILIVPTLLVALGIALAPESDKVPENVGIIMKAGIDDKEKATQIDAVLKECGIETKTITYDSNLDNSTGADEKGYRISTKDLNNIILYLREDNSVYSIRYADEFLYNDNAVVSKITDFYLTTEEKTNLQIKSEQMVKKCLKAPSTADFPNITEWKFKKDKNEIILQSYVDSQNSFGTMIRSEFQIKFSPDGTTVTSFILDGTEYMQQ